MWPRQKQANTKMTKQNSNGDYDGKNDDNITPCEDVALYKDSEQQCCRNSG